jgi:ABC-type enterobactin transport system permease subunit
LLLPGLLICVGLVVLGLLWSITLGAADIIPQTVYQALLHFDSNNFQHLIIQTVRLPRVLTGAIVGASLAVAGAIMHELTRNPLADSGCWESTAGHPSRLCWRCFCWAIHRCQCMRCSDSSVLVRRRLWPICLARWDGVARHP